jgi:hypothetical protein
MLERGTTQEMTMIRIGKTALVGLLAALALALAHLAGPGVEAASAKSAILEYQSTPTSAQAGGHPDIVTEFGVGTRFTELPMPLCACNDPRDIIVHTPPGVIANPHVAAICTAAEAALYNCSADSQVGLMTIKFFSNYAFLPIYRTIPPNDHGGMFVFLAPLGGVAQYMTVDSRTDGDFGLDIATVGIQHLVPLDFYAPIFWGVPGDHFHDILRFLPQEKFVFCFGNPLVQVAAGKLPGDCFVEKTTGNSEVPKAPIETSIPIKPMLQAPTTCIGPLESTLETVAYDNEQDTASASWPETTGCDLLSFNPSLSANPTTAETDSPSGLGVVLKVPQFQDPTTPSPSELRASTVVMPEGFSINPNAADGKTVCTDAEARLGTREPEHCPEFSKVGTVVLDSSALPQPIPGYIFLGEPKPGDTYRLLLTAFGFGTAIKIPGSVRPDAQTGRLTVTFDKLPEAPFQAFDMHFFGAERGLLATPPKCGTLPVSSTFTPWSNALSDQKSTQFFVLDQGPGGKPCPGSTRPFEPGLEAGNEDNTAGKHSSFSLRFTRPDGDQNLTGLDAVAPPGFAAVLKGVPYCSEADLAAITQPSHTGRDELSSPACPAASQIGTAVPSVGAGSKPFYTEGKVYLGGPYKGAPLSLMVAVPGVSGPYDLGNIAVRVALDINPVTARVSAVSDPLPQILSGIPLRLRSLLLRINRPNFVINGTNCAPFAVQSTAHGSEGGVSQSSKPFQIANCADLPYAPKLALRLSGGLHRRGHPAIRATFTAKPGEANNSGVSVTLPKGEQLDSEHIDTVCTRVAFAASNCPAGSIIGRAEATSPLLDAPLRGPVYLRSSDNQLPDMVLDLEGQVDIEVSGQVDAVQGRLRTTFTDVPDVPVSKLTLNLAGGRKGLLINSEPLCGTTKKAKVKMTGQNGVVHRTMTRLRANCGSKARHKRHSGKRTAG